jgi:GNAT superfamily N-acetyltransferase
MLRGVLGGSVGLRPARPPREPHGGISFEAIADRSDGRVHHAAEAEVPARGESRWCPEVAILRRLDVEPAHEDLGCREALLDVAQQWARANTNSALEVVAPSVPAHVRTERLQAATW